MGWAFPQSSRGPLHDGKRRARDAHRHGEELVPLRHRGSQLITRVGEGLTEYRLGDIVGYGLSEYFDSEAIPTP